MANEFIARNGLIALNNTTITGSLLVTGGITGSIFGTSSYTPTLNQVTTAGSTTTNFITIGGLTATGSVTASGALARGNYINNTLVASANNDVLVGLDINPTFATGAFTGTQNLLIRASSISGSASSQIRANSANSGDYSELLLSTTTATNSYRGSTLRNIRGTSDRLAISVTTGAGFTEYFSLFSTGNLLLQNGGTFTDAGYRLDVKGSTRIQGTGTTSATTSLRVENNNSSASLVILDDGTTSITGSVNITGSTTVAGNITPTTSSTYDLGNSATRFRNGYFTGDLVSTNNVITANLWAGTIKPNTGGTTIVFRDTSNNGYGVWFMNTGNLLIQNGGTFTDAGYRLDVKGSTRVQGAGATSATTTFLLQNSTPSNLLTVLDNGQYSTTSPLMILPASQSGFLISQSISSSNTVGGQVYGVNITPTFYQTTASQTETAFRVAATFTGSSTIATSGSNIIADFGATSVGTQFSVNDITSGSIYMVNDVSGLPIIEATSDWSVNMYNYPTKVFQKTGSQVIISGSLWINASGSFSFPLTSSANPPVGSAFWSGSFLYIYDGIRYRSSSFA